MIQRCGKSTIYQIRNLSIVFNGEIYNFSEIKKLLSGYEFKTLSDTEVILASIEIHGIDWFLKEQMECLLLLL